MNFASTVLKPCLAIAAGVFTLPGHAQNDFQRRTSIEISATAASDENTEVGSRRSRYGSSKAMPGLPRIAALLKTRYGIEVPDSGIRRWDTLSVRATAPDTAGDGENPVLAVITTEHLTFRQDGLDWHVTIQHEQNSEQQTCAEGLDPDCLPDEVLVRGMAHTARSALEQRFNRQNRK